MHRVHTTRDGSRLFIAQMDDQHLQNTIKLQLRDLETVTAIVDDDSAADMSPSQAAIFGVDLTEIREVAADDIPSLLVRFYHYLAEAFLRWGDADQEKDDNGIFMAEVLERLRNAVSRRAQMPPLNVRRKALIGGSRKSVPLAQSLGEVDTDPDDPDEL